MHYIGIIAWKMQITMQLPKFSKSRSKCEDKNLFTLTICSDTIKEMYTETIKA